MQRGVVTTEVVIRGGPGRLRLATVAELINHREVWSALVRRAIRVRYRQAFIGAAWAILQPVLATLVFALFLGRLVHVPSEGVPYVPFVLVAMVGWLFFASSATVGAESLITERALLSKQYLPREILPLSAIGVAGVDLCFGFALALIVANIYGLHPTIHYIGLLLPITSIIAFACGVAMIFAALNVYFRDVRLLLPFVLQVGLFASPIAYPLGLVRDPWRDVYLFANPMAGSVDSIRATVLHGTWPDGLAISASLITSFVVFGFGYWLFKRLERRFVDLI